MSDATLSAQRGTTIGFELPVLLNGEEFDVTADGTSVAVTFKKRRADTEALIAKAYQAGVSSAIKLAIGSTNVLLVDLLPADTAAQEDGTFVGTEFLVWDAILTEPDGRQTAIAKGSLTVRAGVGS